MKKFLALIITILLVFTSCELQDSRPSEQVTKKASTEQKIKEIPVHKVSVIVYEGCEYIIYKEDKNANSSYGFLAHKGNCSNRIHKCK